MGYCFSPPMLVYEYMEEGNLHEWLFTDVCTCSVFSVLLLFSLLPETHTEVLDMAR